MWQAWGNAVAVAAVAAAAAAADVLVVVAVAAAATTMSCQRLAPLPSHSLTAPKSTLHELSETGTGFLACASCTVRSAPFYSPTSDKSHKL